MNLVNMQFEILRKLNDFNLKLDIKSSEMSNAINEALYLFIDKYAAIFQQDERARKALSLLTNYQNISSFSSSSSIIPSSQSVTLPADILYTVMELATLNGEIVKVKPVSLDSYKTNIDNPYKKPYRGLVWRIDLKIDGAGVNKTHILVSNGTITNYTIGYIKTPTRYTIDDNPTQEIQVQEMFQWEIIDTAIELLLRPRTKD